METFSVYYFSSEELGNIQECEVKHVDFDTACKWFRHHTTNVTANMGFTRRVIMTDGGDCIVAEWEYGKGLIWPRQEDK